MNEQDFLKLLNAVVKIAKPFNKEAPDIDSMDLQFKDTNIDSLDMLLVGMYLADVFGISEEAAKQIAAPTPRELFELVKKVATEMPADVDKTIEGLK